MPRRGSCPTGGASICPWRTEANAKRCSIERDFADIADLGFNFLRLALNYRDWTDGDDPKRLREPVLKEIDRAVQQGKQHGIHLLLDFHIAPGFGQIYPPERTTSGPSPGRPSCAPTSGRSSPSGTRAFPTAG